MCELSKRFVIFEVKIGDDWYPACKSAHEGELIHSIKDFPTYSVDIDFNCPEKTTNTLTAITEAVEDECPVAKAFGVEGIGEGVVWSTEYKDQVLRFKVKGEKHTSSKVKKLANVDIEKIESIDKFVEYAVTPSRLSQGIEVVFTQENLDLDIKMMGKYLKWVMGDIVKEEMDTLKGNNLEPKDISRAVNTKSREYFMKVLDEEYIK